MPAKPAIALIAGLGCIMTISVALPVAAAPAIAPNPVRGGQLFLQCRACHTVTAGAPPVVGPNLTGIVGVKAATRPGYVYSSALIKYGKVWTAATLDAYLKRPSQAVPGTKMAYGGMADAKARADVIAYLKTLKGRR